MPTNTGTCQLTLAYTHLPVAHTESSPFRQFVNEHCSLSVYTRLLPNYSRDSLFVKVTVGTDETVEVLKQ